MPHTLLHVQYYANYISHSQFTECKVHCFDQLISYYQIPIITFITAHTTHLMFTCCYAYRDYLFIFRLLAFSAFHVVNHCPHPWLLTRISSLAASQICAYDERNKKKHFAKTGQSKCHVQMCLYLDRVEVVPHTHTRTHSTRVPY